MNTRDLEYFVALCDEKNFSQVAKNFNVTQPTITLALKRLESQFAIQLIDRDQSHGSITITPAGQQLYQRAKVVGKQLSLAQKELRALRHPKIRFGLPPIIGSFYFPKLAPRLVTSGLMPDLETHEAGSTNLLEDLRAGHLDVALLGATGPLAAPDLDVHTVAADPFVAVMPKDHELAKRESISFAELAEEPFVTFSEGYVHTKAMQWFTQAAGIQPSVVYRTPDVALLKSMIHARVGIGLLATTAVTPADDLALVPLSESGQPRFSISVVTRRGQVLTPTMTELMKLLNQHA